jgi:ABC-type branched-subunit amino acid transport system ATPase component
MQPPEPFPTTPQGTAKFIRVTQLTKRFAEATAVNGVFFEVRRGELFGFLGPNGAGKTTTINLLTGLARPDSGAILIAGILFFATAFLDGAERYFTAAAGRITKTGSPQCDTTRSVTLPRTHRPIPDRP